MDERKAYIIHEVTSCIRSIVPDAKIFLYGSRARGDNRVDSDWDFLVLIEDSLKLNEIDDQIRGSVRELGWKLKEDISVMVQTDKHAYLFQLAPFYLFIRKEGIEV
ncbi:MAG: nucleotidyltransferase domain-containing protein [Bacteroidetes bacterium]|nr:nucleotidyltransferase domain-containing protein [Bacteroidota bacterium]